MQQSKEGIKIYYLFFLNKEVEGGGGFVAY